MQVILKLSIFHLESSLVVSRNAPMYDARSIKHQEVSLYPVTQPRNAILEYGEVALWSWANREVTDKGHNSTN